MRGSVFVYAVRDEPTMDAHTGNIMAGGDVPDHIEALAELFCCNGFDSDEACFITTDMLREAMYRSLARKLSERLH